MKRFVCHIDNLLINSARIGKQLAVKQLAVKQLAVKPLTVTWILILAMLFVTCGSDKISEEADEIEYTDVEYEEDGTGVTIYLDGVGVPKSRAQRAISTDLAKMAFDFIEVIFIDGGIVRTSWVLGESAKVNNINTGSYGSILKACMFVGRDDRKILLGVGKLTSTNTGGTNITADTRSVTFSIAAIQSGLLAGSEALNAPVNGGSVVANSFNYTYVDAAGGGSRIDSSFRKPLGGIQYPVYVISDRSTVNSASYNFAFSDNATDCQSAIKHVGSTNPPVVQKKTPRYMKSVWYEEPRNAIDAYTEVVLSGYNPGPGDSLVLPITLTFSMYGNSGGLFAFNIQIPVYMVDNGKAVKNGGPDAVTWYIRTGVGTEFYSLDDGVSRGGCVLMFIGNVETASSDFDNIIWTRFKGF